MSLVVCWPGDSFLKHIATTSNSSVVLRGRGSLTAEGPEPLQLHIISTSAKDLESAKSLSQDLIATIKEEYDKHHSHGAAAAATPSGNPTSSNGATSAPAVSSYQAPAMQQNLAGA